MRKIYFSIILMLIFSTSDAFAQVQFAAPAKLVCPGENVPYSIFPASPPNCTYTWTVTNGLFSNGSTTIQGTELLHVTVIWNNVQATSATVAPKGTLTVQVSNCALPTGEDSNDVENNIVITTLNGVTPGIMSGNTSLSIGSTTAVTYSIQKVLFPNTGIPGQTQTDVYADSYQWIIPSGWKIGTNTSNGTTPITGQSHSVSVIPNACGGAGAKVRVRAYSSCGSGYTSNWREITITRPLPRPRLHQSYAMLPPPLR